MTLDEFRQAADSFSEFDEFEPPEPQRTPRFLGLTPAQMFIVSLLILMLSCLLSTFCLLASGKVAPAGFVGM